MNVIRGLYKKIWLVVILIYFWNFWRNNPSWWELGHNLLLSRAFRWESLWRWDFRLLRSLWLSRGLFTNSSSFTMEFWLSRSLLMNFYFSRRNFGYQGAFHTIFFHNEILAIREPFTNFSFTRWSLFTNFSFTRWNSCYHEAFSRISLSHDGILAITKPFHEFLFHTMESWLSRSLFTNFFFTRWNSGYHEVFSRISLSHDEILAITKPFHEFLFHRWNSQNARFGGRLFSYISQRVFT
jgi:hypothetical protein